MQQQANLVRARPLPRTEDLRFDLLLAAVPTTTAPEATEQKSNRLLSGETPGACNRTPRTRWSTISEDGLERPGETSTGKASPKSKDGNTAANGYSSIGHHRGSTQPPTVPPPKSLPETTSNPNPTHISPFREIHRIDAAAVRHDQITAIADDYIRRGIPLLVSNVTSSWGRFATESQGVSSIESKMDWDQSLLSLDWMVEKMGGTVLQVRDVAAGRDTPRTVSEFVDYIRRRSSVMGKGTSDLDPMTLTAESNRVGESSHSLTVSGEQRSQKVMSSAHSVDEPLLYGKDILCPPEWTEYLNNHLPEYFQYKGPNDLVTALPKRLQPDNLMVYIGVDKTHTPAHTDICGAVGHNIMLWAEPNSTSFWFIAASGDEHKFAKLCSQNGGSLHTDSYVCPVDVLATADFPLYVAEQRPGDFIIVPPNCPHQVVNKGGITMKAAWNRMTLSALETCFSQVLPVYRLYFKQEVYRIKTVIHRLLHYMANLATVRLGRDSGTTTYEQFPPSTILSRLPNPVFLQEFLRALSLYRASLKDEWIDERFAEQTLHLSSITALPSRFAMAPDQIERYADASTSPHCRSCNICRADIWNRGYTCKLCAASQDESDEEFDACLYCYAHGRSCKHGVENLVMCEYFPMPQLLAELEEAVSTFEELRRSAAASGDEDQIPGPCLIECDLNNDHGGNYSVASIARYRERIRQIGLSTSCHACKSSKNLAEVLQCRRTPKHGHFCASCLWNRFGLKILEASFQRDWVCPVCTETCNCIRCIRARRQNFARGPKPPNEFVNLTRYFHFDPHRYTAAIHDLSLPNGTRYAEKNIKIIAWDAPAPDASPDPASTVKESTPAVDSREKRSLAPSGDHLEVPVEPRRDFVSGSRTGYRRASDGFSGKAGYAMGMAHQLMSPDRSSAPPAKKYVKPESGSRIGGGTGSSSRRPSYQHDPTFDIFAQEGSPHKRKRESDAGLGSKAKSPQKAAAQTKRARSFSPTAAKRSSVPPNNSHGGEYGRRQTRTAAAAGWFPETLGSSMVRTKEGDILFGTEEALMELSGEQHTEADQAFSQESQLDANYPIIKGEDAAYNSEREETNAQQSKKKQKGASGGKGGRGSKSLPKSAKKRSPVTAIFPGVGGFSVSSSPRRGRPPSKIVNTTPPKPIDLNTASGSFVALINASLPAGAYQQPSGLQQVGDGGEVPMPVDMLSHPMHSSGSPVLGLSYLAPHNGVRSMVPSPYYAGSSNVQDSPQTRLRDPGTAGGNPHSPLRLLVSAAEHVSSQADSGRSSDPPVPASSSPAQLNKRKRNVSRSIMSAGGDSKAPPTKTEESVVKATSSTVLAPSAEPTLVNGNVNGNGRTVHPIPAGSSHIYVHMPRQSGGAGSSSAASSNYPLKKRHLGTQNESVSQHGAHSGVHISAAGTRLSVVGARCEMGTQTPEFAHPVQWKMVPDKPTDRIVFPRVARAAPPPATPLKSMSSDPAHMVEHGWIKAEVAAPKMELKVEGGWSGGAPGLSIDGSARVVDISRAEQHLGNATIAGETAGLDGISLLADICDMQK